MKNLTEENMSISPAKIKSVLLIMSSIVSCSVFAEPEQESEPPPWYAVEAIAGVQTTGECIETMSALQVLDAVKLGMARIVSEKKAGGKVTQLTFAYQGVQGTIYRDRATCEAVARATHKKRNATPDRYK
jgi:hypothetical protein